MATKKPAAKEVATEKKDDSTETVGATRATRATRGRPKKFEAESAEPTQFSLEKKPARKRGRPAKEKTDEEEPAEPAVKRGRGRPRKEVVPEDPNTPKPPPRPRGRPRKEESNRALKQIQDHLGSGKKEEVTERPRRSSRRK